MACHSNLVVQQGFVWPLVCMEVDLVMMAYRTAIIIMQLSTYLAVGYVYDVFEDLGFKECQL